MWRLAPVLRSYFAAPSCVLKSTNQKSSFSSKLFQKHQAPKIMNQSIRCLMEREVSRSVEAALKARDRVPDDYTIIYRAPLEKYIKVTYASTVVAIGSVPCILASIFFFGDIHTYPMEYAGITLFETVTDVYLMAGLLSLVAFNVAHTVAKYPFRIYKHSQESKYISVFQSFIPGVVKRIEFKAGEVKKCNGLLWKDSLYKIKNKKILLIPDHFFTPIHLDLMTVDPDKQNPAAIQKRRSKMV